MHLCCLWTSFKKVVLPDPLDPTQTVSVMVKGVCCVVKCYKKWRM